MELAGSAPSLFSVSDDKVSLVSWFDIAEDSSCCVGAGPAAGEPADGAVPLVSDGLRSPCDGARDSGWVVAGACSPEHVSQSEGSVSRNESRRGRVERKYN